MNEAIKKLEKVLEPAQPSGHSVKIECSIKEHIEAERALEELKTLAKGLDELRRWLGFVNN